MWGVRWYVASLAHLIHRRARICCWAWYNHLESHGDWVLTPLSMPGQNLPCPSSPTLPCSHSRCQVGQSARRDLALRQGHLQRRKRQFRSRMIGHCAQPTTLRLNASKTTAR